MNFRKTIAVILLIASLFTIAAQASQGVMMEQYAQNVVNQVNMERAKLGLSPLRLDAGLSSAAQVRAKEIAEKFSHTRPDGSHWSTVYSAAYGENIARGQKTPDKVMAAWLTSDGHRANIQRASYGSIGVSCYMVNGIYHWVQMFGR